MTVAASTRKAGPFEGNDSTTSYPFAFKVFNASEVVVVHTDSAGVESTLTAGSDYTVSLNSDQNENPGGVVTYPVNGDPLPDGEKLTITSSVPETQGTKLPNGASWNPQTVERALDKLTILLQQLSERLGRTVSFPISDPEIGGELPTVAQRMGRVLGFTDTGAMVALASMPTSGVAVTSAAEQLLDDASFEDMLQTLGAAPAGSGARVVDSIEALRDLIAEEGTPQATVRGYYGPNTPGGGLFIYDANDDTSADDGGMVIVANDGSRWKRLPAGYVDPYWFGARGDGFFARDGAITSGLTTFTSQLASFTEADVGKLIKVGKAGNSNATLVTTIASVNSEHSVELSDAAGSTVTSANFTYGTDDLEAFEAARDYGFAHDIGMRVQSGRYCFSDTLELARRFWSVVPASTNVWLEFFLTSSKPGLSLNGLTQSQYGVHRFSFGTGEMAFNIRGCSQANPLLYYNNIHWGTISANLRDGAIAIKGDKSDGEGGEEGFGGAVGTDFYIRVSEHSLGSFDATPSVGWYMTHTYACRIRMQVEHCGAPGGNPGLYVANSNGNYFIGGTVESCNDIGCLISSSSERNVFTSVHNEFNGGADWDVRGHRNIFIGCAGVGTYADLDEGSGEYANVVSGDYNTFLGGEYNDFVVTSDADHTTVIGADLSIGTVGFNGTNTTVYSCAGTTERAPAPPLSAPTFASGFSSSGSHQPVRYTRTRTGQIQVQGVAVMGTINSHPATILTLPAGYRPSAAVTYVGHNITTNTPVGLRINTDGTLTTLHDVASGDSVSLNSPFYNPA